MPQRAPTRCTLCPRIATNAGRCDEHQRQPWENPSANSRALTGAQRNRFRKAVLAAHNHVCVMCGAEATQADHIIEVAELIRLGGDPTDPSNGQALCDDCHQRKTRAMARARRARRRTDP